MEIKIKNVFLIIILMSVLLLNARAGDSNFSTTYGPRTLARDGLFVAGIDGLGASISNPAGLVYMNGNSISISVLDRNAQQEFYSAERGLFRSFRRNDFGFGGGAFWVISQSLAASITATRAADYQVEWPYAMMRRKETTVSILAFDLYNRIHVDAVSPSIAFRIGNIALGLSGNIYQFKNQISIPISNQKWYEGIGKSAYQFEYDQDGWDYNFRFGVMTTLSDKLRLGASVSSSSNVSLEGKATSDMFAEVDSTTDRQVNLKSEFEFPWQIGAGANYKWSENLEVNIDLAYHLWGDTQERINFEFNDSTWQNSLTVMDSAAGFQGNSLAQYFNNSFEFGAGLEYFQSPSLSILAGYRFSKSPNSNTSYSLLYPGVSQHWFSAGVSYKSDNYIFDAALAYGFGVEKEVTNINNIFTQGKYDSYTLIPLINFQYQF
ncbi:outer membrane protein transport protein [candidate division KSB1 bacterium]|nr:outer membrane protein transport protein [candidate division KSB1 bacterium]